ncbi:MAG: hypothetical protein Q9166_002317 [cf. Caloplaca sp. 2 TL-2023]
MSSSKAQPSTPYRQIRANYDSKTITVYQAYSAAIAIPAVEEQKLNASPTYKPHRMTWIKPSWAWMMYRSGYSYKDPNQSHILALKIPHKHFLHLLSLASVTSHSEILTPDEKSKPVRVQWDPERSVRMEVLPCRSIQIGISGEVVGKFVEEWVESIEDVTSMARGLKKVVDEDKEVLLEELVERGLVVPRERVYEVDEKLRRVLEMVDER